MSRASRLQRMETSFLSVPRVADYIPRRTRWATNALIAITVILFVGAIAVIAKGSPRQTPQPRFERFAELVVGDWLAGRPLSVPTTAGITATSSETPFSAIKPATPAAGAVGGATSPGRPAFDIISAGYWRFSTDSTGKQSYTETDHFLIQADGGYYDVAVSVLDANGVPLLDGLPTLAPTGFAGRPNVRQSVPLGWLPHGLSAGETNQVDQWAKAYVSGDQQTLYELTGDSRATHYIGLGGNWHLDGTPSVSASWANAKAGTAVARVELSVTRKDQSLGISYDLLLGDVGQRNLPPVQAWGPTASGFTLRPYSNAIAGATGGP